MTDPSELGTETRVSADTSSIPPPRKRTGTAGLILIVLFLVSLLSFGRAPFTTIEDARGVFRHVDILSSLGVVGGVCAIVFFVSLLVRRIRPTSIKSILESICAVGLIVHSTLAVSASLCPGTDTRPGTRIPPPHGTGSNLVLGQLGPETWAIDGQEYRIATTYYLRLGNGLQFTIEYPHRFDESKGPMDNERALPIVFPLMKHAYEKGLYKRTYLAKLGEGTLHPTRIGVTLLERRGPERVQGYRIGLSVEQIRERIENAGKE